MTGLRGPVHWQAINLPCGLEPELLNVSCQFLGMKDRNEICLSIRAKNSFRLLYPTVANICIPLCDKMLLAMSERPNGCQEALKFRAESGL